MNRAEFMSSSDLLLEKALKVLSAKAAYSTDADALSGLKADAAANKVVGLDLSRATHRCLSEIVKKVRRLVDIEARGFPSGADSAEDSALDIINYTALYFALVKEATDGKENPAG